MNTRFPSSFKAFAALVAIASSATIAAPRGLAQASPRQLITVNVPFEFNVGGRHFDSGSYSLRLLNGRFVEGSGATSSVTMPAANKDPQPSAQTKLVFHRYGEHYFLNTVWTEGQSEHLQWPVSNAERHVEIVSNRAAPDGTKLAIVELPQP